MEIFVSAGEASSDIHCAKLVEELKKQSANGDLITTFGLGGDNLAATGTRLLMHSSDFSVAGGPLEVISKLPLRRRLERTLERYLYENAPKNKIKGAIVALLLAPLFFTYVTLRNPRVLNRVLQSVQITCSHK